MLRSNKGFLIPGFGTEFTFYLFLRSKLPRRFLHLFLIKDCRFSCHRYYCCRSLFRPLTSSIPLITSAGVDFGKNRRNESKVASAEFSPSSIPIATLIPSPTTVPSSFPFYYFPSPFLFPTTSFSYFFLPSLFPHTPVSLLFSPPFTLNESFSVVKGKESSEGEKGAVLSALSRHSPFRYLFHAIPFS